MTATVQIDLAAAHQQHTDVPAGLARPAPCCPIGGLPATTSYPMYRHAADCGAGLTPERYPLAGPAPVRPADREAVRHG